MNATLVITQPYYMVQDCLFCPYTFATYFIVLLGGAYEKLYVKSYMHEV